MSNQKNEAFLKQFDRGVTNPAAPAPMPSQPLGFRTPDGKFHPTVAPPKKKK